MDILRELYNMTAFGAIVAQPGVLLMLLVGFVLLYLGIAKKYEPLLLVPIAFGVILANLPGWGYGRGACRNGGAGRWSLPQSV